VVVDTTNINLGAFMKKILLSTLMTLGFASSGQAVDLATCSQNIKTEAMSVLSAISDLDETNTYSEAMIDILGHSVTGMVSSAPSCEALKNLKGHYQTAFKDLKKPKKPKAPVANGELGESAWDYDSCSENMMRQFTCLVNNSKVFFDLEKLPLIWKTKNADAKGEKIYGFVIEKVQDGQVYVTCDDSSELQVVQYQVGKTSTTVSCEIPAVLF